MRENIAPIRVVIANSQELLGCFRVTFSVVADTGSALATTFIPALSEVVQLDLTRSMLNAASCAVKGLPSLKVTPSRSVKV